MTDVTPFSRRGTSATFRPERRLRLAAEDMTQERVRADAGMLALRAQLCRMLILNLRNDPDTPIAQAAEVERVAVVGENLLKRSV